MQSFNTAYADDSQYQQQQVYLHNKPRPSADSVSVVGELATFPTYQPHPWSLQDRLEHNGFIYQGSYEGWYSINDEAFYHSDDVSWRHMNGSTI